jgi:hypothetical protein
MVVSEPIFTIRLLYRAFYAGTEFHANPKNGLVSDSRVLVDGRTGACGVRIKRYFFSFLCQERLSRYGRNASYFRIRPTSGILCIGS